MKSRADLIREIDHLPIDDLETWMGSVLRYQRPRGVGPDLPLGSRDPDIVLGEIYEMADNRLQQKMKKILTILLISFNSSYHSKYYLGRLVFLAGLWNIPDAYKIMRDWLVQRRFVGQYLDDIFETEDLHLFILRAIVHQRPEDDEDFVNKVLEKGVKPENTRTYPYHFAVCFRELSRSNSENIPKYFGQLIDLSSDLLT